MRKPLQEITDPEVIRAFLQAHRYLFLSVIDGDEPYTVPLNYGCKFDEDGNLIFYFHTSVGGRLYDIMERCGWHNVKACFGIAEMKGIAKTTIGYCEWDTDYKSILGSGLLSRVEGDEARTQALVDFMAHYGATQNVHFVPARMRAVTVYEFKVTDYHMKKSKAELDNNPPETM